MDVSAVAVGRVVIEQPQDLQSPQGLPTQLRLVLAGVVLEQEGRREAAVIIPYLAQLHLLAGVVLDH